MTLKEWRAGKGLNIEQAAKLFGIDRTYLLRLEAGQRDASAELMRRIREVSENAISAEHLIGLGAPAPSNQDTAA